MLSNEPALTTGDIVLTILGLFFLSYIVAVIFYYIGKHQGEKQAYKRPDMCYPRIPEVTIIGKYRIPKQSTDQIAKNLSQWLIYEGYGCRVYPNIVQIIHATWPPQATRKKSFFEKLEVTRDGVPFSLDLLTYPSNEQGEVLEVSARCLPMLHAKLGTQVQFAFPKSSVEDAQRLCKDFMEMTMRVLNAEVVTEPYVESSLVPLKHLEFLYNTPSESNIIPKAHELMANSRKQILVAGWIDREFLGDLENATKRGIKVRVLTKSTEGSDQMVRVDFKGLLAKIGKENVKLNSNFHDRFLICDNQCILGSMYYTGSGKTRYESAVYTDDESILSNLLVHFERIWTENMSKTPA